MSVVLTGDRLFNTGERSCTSDRGKRRNGSHLLTAERKNNTKTFQSLSLAFTSEA